MKTTGICLRLAFLAVIPFLSRGAGTELAPFPDLSAPRAITSGPHDHFYANYFGINAWSPDNRYALVLETDIKDHLPDGAPCTLGLVDLADGNRFIPVTTTRCWNFQEAAMAHWMPCEKDTFVFNDLRNGRFCAVVMNWKTKKERVYPFPISAVSEDGTWALSINYARLYLTRPDYGYAGGGQDARKGVVFPEDDGIFRVDLQTGEAKLIVPTAAVKGRVPAVGPSGLSYLCHTVISKDMKRLYFLSRSVEEPMEGENKFKDVRWETTAFTCNADGSEIRRCFPDGWGSSHFNWKPNLSERDARTMIVTCKWLNKVYTHVEFTVGEEDRPRQVGGEEMHFDGHCIYSPDGNFISGDGYWDKDFFRHWKMVRLADNRVKDLGKYFIPETYRDVYCRCDLHPRWRPDGKQIGFNSVHEGSRQAYVMDVLTQPTAALTGRSTVSVSLCGAWEMAYRPHFLEVNDYPSFVGKTIPNAVPGYWEDMVDDFRAAGIKDEFRINPEWSKRSLPACGWAADTQLPQPYGLFFYRRTVDVAEPRDAYLEFEGVRNDVRVWLNGRFVEHREGYSTPFRIDVPAEFLVRGPNEIVLAVQNKLNVGYNGADVRGLTSRALFRATGGVNGKLALVFPGDGIRDVYVTTAPDLKTFTVHVDGKDEYAYEVGPLRGRARGDLVLPSEGLSLWTPENPVLHTLTLTTPGDRHVVTFGIRRLEARGTKLFLNGKPTYLRGVTEHCYYPETVHLPRSREFYRSIAKKRKELGFNFVRFHTFVPPIEYLQATDELGMLVEIESPNFVPEWEYASIIRFARTHASVVIYSTGNEVRIDRLAEAYLERIADLVHAGTDSLFSPESALRGVSYVVFPEVEPVVHEPFPHNRERMSRLARFSDVFNAIGRDATSYDYIDGASAVQLESWSSVWAEKPRLLHEICIDGTYADLSLEGMYADENPIKRTGLFSEVRRVLTEKGIIDRWPVYFTNSCAWVAQNRKFAFEKARACESVAGFDFLGDINTHWHTFGYSVGMMDEFYRLKPCETVKNVLRYNSPTVLIADFGTDFVFETGTVRPTEIRVSNYGGDRPGERLELTLVEADGGKVVWREVADTVGARDGALTKLGRFDVRFPEGDRPCKYLLTVTLGEGAQRVENAWETFAFPRPVDVDVPVRTVTDISREDLLAAMRNGERLVLLGTGPFKTLPMSYNNGRAGRCGGNFATVIDSEHPVFVQFQHAGFCDWRFRRLMDGARVVQMEADVPFAPIVDVASAVKCPIRQAAMFEYRVGEGRLLVCSFCFRKTDPAAAYLRSVILDYASSDGFEPKTAISVEALVALIDHPAVETSGNPNRAANPGDPSGYVRALGDHVQP